MKFIKGFGQFWYDFLIGDDWKIAAGVLLVLAVGVAIILGGSYSDAVLTIGLALGIAAAFSVALMIDVRGSAPQKKH